MNAIEHRGESGGSARHGKGAVVWICGRVLRTGASPAGRVDKPVDNADALPTASPTLSRASRPQAPQDQPPVMRSGCPYRPFDSISASHSNPSQHRLRAGSPTTLQAHFRMGLDSPRFSAAKTGAEQGCSIAPIRPEHWSSASRALMLRLAPTPIGTGAMGLAHVSSTLSFNLRSCLSASNCASHRIALPEAPCRKPERRVARGAGKE